MTGLMLMLLRWLLAIVAAFFIGKLVQRLRLPAILGWLIAGMVLGPCAVGLIPQKLMDSTVYDAVIDWMQVAVGVMLGTELVWKNLKKSGKALIVTTLTQSLGTFIVVSAVFAVVLYFTGLPAWLGLVFGSIALATAPLPALSIVQEFHTKGPVTDTLLPMSILDDLVGIIVFFSVNASMTKVVSGGSFPISLIPAIIIVPILIGILPGLAAGAALRRGDGKVYSLGVLLAGVTISAILVAVLYAGPLKSLSPNYMLTGVTFAAVFSNMIPGSKLDLLVEWFNPILGISILVCIVDLGAPLDYHLIIGAGLYTFVYIASRAAGKYFGARFGAGLMHMPDTVRKYLGLTLLPHSGVSLIFTGIACQTLAPMPELAQTVQGTIAAAAVINEIIAVICAKEGFRLAGEIHETQDKARTA